MSATAYAAFRLSRDGRAGSCVGPFKALRAYHERMRLAREDNAAAARVKLPIVR